MKKLIALLLLLSSTSIAQHIIPLPNQMVLQEGTYSISPNYSILAAEGLEFEIAYLKNQLSDHYAFPPKTASNNITEIYLKLDMDGQKEAYELQITSGKITINAGHASGVFYGIQSLLQMAQSAENGQLQALKITDAPRFSWRGMHLDVSRHFFTVEEVKKYLDYMAMYKMNSFHWHLTEDQGWRIEIKKYPKLTDIGAWRAGTMLGHYSDHQYDTLRYGGFYTQEEIKEVVAYATERHINVVPEIEMPGHSLAALTAYPEFSCTGGPFEVAQKWGVFEDVYCAGNEATFQFLQDVLDEVITLFPSEYIHIGGDECPKTRWKACEKCQARMTKEGLRDEHELQSYFIQRIEKYVNSKGRKIIGWDEILEGGLAPNAAVMSWRGTEGGIAAAKAGHEAVMSPGSPCYFDHYQSEDKSNEPIAIGGFNPLHKVYAYEPQPASLNEEESQFILGAQGNVWTEYMKTFEHVEYMALPRMSALAEVLWTQAEWKDYNNYLKRLKMHSAILDNMGVNYAKHYNNDLP